MDSRAIIEKNKQAYDQIAEDWHKDHQVDTWWIEGTDKFISLMPAGSLVLDAGCGGGFKSAYMLKRGLNVIGTDPSEKMIDIACRENPSGKFRVLSLQQSDTLPEVFDGIFIQASLLHVPLAEVKDVFTKVLSRLKEGGYIYVAVKEKKAGRPEEEIKVESDYGYSYERFFSYFTIDEIKDPLMELGCEIVHESITPWENTRWIQVIGRKK